eukprot:7832382-Pyramimonas_sp.AAC.1
MCVRFVSRRNSRLVRTFVRQRGESVGVRGRGAPARPAGGGLRGHGRHAAVGGGERAREPVRVVVNRHRQELQTLTNMLKWVNRSIGCIQEPPEYSLTAT